MITEGKMAEIHQDMQDMLDKHIKKFKSNNIDADTLGRHCVNAGKKLAAMHKFEPEHGHKFVNDYVDNALKEESELEEMSNEKLTAYKGKAAKDLWAKLKQGDKAAAAKRARGIHAAMKNVKEEVELEEARMPLNPANKSKEDNIAKLKQSYLDKVRWSNESNSTEEKNRHLGGAMKLKNHLKTQYGVDINESINLVAILKNKATGNKARVWQKSEGGYNYDVDYSHGAKKNFSLPLEKVIKHHKNNGYESVPLEEGQSLSSALNNALSKPEPGSKLDRSIKQHNQAIKLGLPKDHPNIRQTAPDGHHFDKKGFIRLGEESELEENWTKDGLHLDLKNVKVPDDYMRPEYEQYLKDHGAKFTIIKMKKDGMGHKIPKRVYDMVKEELEESLSDKAWENVLAKDKSKASLKESEYVELEEGAFKALVKSLMAKGMSKDQAGGIAYKHGVEKYGKDAMTKAAKEGVPAASVNESKLEESLLYKQTLHHIRVDPTSSTDRDRLGKIGMFGEKSDLSNDDEYKNALNMAHKYGMEQFGGKYSITHMDHRGHSIRGGSVAKVRREMK